MQDLLMGMALGNRGFINKMLDSALEFILGVIEQIPPYIDGVRFLEDWAGQDGLFMGLES